jgi:pimeloyl-[acyl-carrier protein] methyl ester esterase
MRDRLVLLSGWGLGTAPLEPLVAALRGLNERLQVEIEPLPDLTGSDPEDWLDELDATIAQDCWLGGWSLGGMLATQLAARRGDRCCGLLTLASNACFVAREDWPLGMPESTFAGFRQGCSADAGATLKRFALLAAQGAADPRGIARLLVASAPQPRAEVLLASLDLLAVLDSRQAVQQFRGPQMHLLAAADALVPVSVSSALLGLQPDIEIGVLESASHAFVLERPHELAASIQAFLSEAGDD